MFGASGGLLPEAERKKNFVKEKLADRIVRFRMLILPIVLLAAVFAGTCIGRTNINYDLGRYLSKDTMTRRALEVMTGEFGTTEQLRIMFVDPADTSLQKILNTLRDLPEVRLCTYDGQESVRVSEGRTCCLVTLTLNECDAGELVMRLRGMFPEAGEYYVGGAAASTLDVQKLVAEEIPLVMLISVGIVIAVLLLTSHAWLEPFIILTVLGASIIINMGTNSVFPDVSFITFAVCAILQLALSIDYAIMLLHTFNASWDAGLPAAEAMKDALARCFMRIASSALTTVAGLLALLFMSFTIGFDIGLVLSKGILISMLGVFLLMPAVTLLLEKPLRASRHKPLKIKGELPARCIERACRPMALILVAAVLLGAWQTSLNQYTFTNDDEMGKSDSAVINEVFGASNPLVLLVPGGEEDEDYERQRELIGNLTAIDRADGSPAFGEVTAMVTTGSEALRYLTAEDTARLTGLPEGTVRLFFALQGFGGSVRADRLLEAASVIGAGNETIRELSETLAAAKEALIGPHYQRMLLEMNFHASDEDFERIIERVISEAEGVYGDDFYITGNAMSTYDIGRAFTGDLLKVNLITFAAILLIVVISFRAFRLPLLLVFVIEGAIWLTMGISHLMGEPVFFMAYLICLAIQMGATIDYGILLCDQYRSLRKAGADRHGALAETMEKSMPTILTSGTILVTAGYVIGRRCSVYYISAIGLLLSRGALISALLVLTLLPSLLLLADHRERKEQI